jgi:serine/threonine-protein kinase HipA
MKITKSIKVTLFDNEIGTLGYDNQLMTSFFQFNPDFLNQNQFKNIFPYIFKRIPSIQKFTQYNGETFRGLPPMIADSLPDMFGNIIFKEWLHAQNKEFKNISALDQLTYVGNRGMGALEYKPSIEILPDSTIEIPEIIDVVSRILELKSNTSQNKLNSQALLNIYKIGTSAGGARPKILISENKATGEIIPGDLNASHDFDHYLVKINIDEGLGYSKEKIEYAYYQLAKLTGIQMAHCKLIDDKHFATIRFDRQDGKKIHTLTACGMTGWDYKKAEDSSYENLFKLAIDLNLPLSDINELFLRMVFNVVFSNIDDHLKNHSFIYNHETDSWNLSPAYDITYSLNVNLVFSNINRALSINQKRQNITRTDLLKIANEFSIKNPDEIIDKVVESSKQWHEIATNLELPIKVIDTIEHDFNLAFRV